MGFLRGESFGDVRPVHSSHVSVGVENSSKCYEISLTKTQKVFVLLTGGFYIRSAPSRSQLRAIANLAIWVQPSVCHYCGESLAWEAVGQPDLISTG